MTAPHPDSNVRAPVVSLQNVSKTYVLWEDPSARLYALFRRMFFRTQETGGKLFTAVQDVNLEIAQGECIGIIGRNGAGKSTLLQIIAGTLQPSAGKVTVRGRVAALLELGSGFNPDFTGRENIHLNASILGLTKAQILTKFASIVAYSGIEEFIDQPVRTYSSGMTLRLAFAVCVHVDADVIIIDEALAVGDARFQFKCHATLDQMLKEGRTIIFVSHDTNSVKRMCRTALLLERGEVLLKGSPNDVTNIYTKLITSPQGVAAIRADIKALNQSGSPEADTYIDTVPLEDSQFSSPAAQLASIPHSDNLLSEERAHQLVSDKEYAYGGKLGQIVTVQLTDAKDQPRQSFLTGSRIRVRIRCRAIEEVTEPIYALTLKNVSGQEIYGTNTYFQNQMPPPVPAGGQQAVTFELQLNILPGVYFISLGWVRLENSEVEVVQRRYDVLRFDVLPRDRSFGLAYCPTNITVTSLTS